MASHGHGNGVKSTTARADAINFYRQVAEKHPIPGDTPGYHGKDELAYELSRVPERTPRPLKVICVGAGFSGLNFAHEVETGAIEAVDLRIYEKNSSLGGTWFENRYPGCACDIPVHNYAFSWAPFPFFPSFYAPRKYIFEYLEEVADQHNLRQYVRTCHKVVGAKWIDERKKWQVQIVQTDGREHVVSAPGSAEGELDEPFIEECDVFINASGAYNNWRWPTIPNRETFTGTMIHPAQWPQDYDATNKTIALIGNGSTGIQILPSVVDQASKVYVMLRSRTWVTPALAQRFAGPPGTNKVFTEEEKREWSENPEKYLAYRKEIENELNARFRLYVKDSQAQKMGRKMTTDQMSQRLAEKPELVDELLPDFAVGCRRPTPGSGYLEALCSPKVQIVWGDIETFNESGLRSASGEQVDVDTIICATGYNMGFVPRFPIIGSHGRDLRDDWRDELPAAYLSVTVANMPNYFVYMGPTSPLGHGSIVGSVEHVTGYIKSLLNKLQTEAYASFSPKKVVTKAWQAHALKWMDKTVWVEGCPSSFKNGASSGPVISLHPGSRLHYFDLLENPRFEDFEWTSLCEDPMDMFAWLADGFTTWETHATRDLSYYLVDAPHLQQRSERSKEISKPVST